MYRYMNSYRRYKVALQLQNMFAEYQIQKKQQLWLITRIERLTQRGYGGECLQEQLIKDIQKKIHKEGQEWKKVLELVVHSSNRIIDYIYDMTA